MLPWNAGVERFEARPPSHVERSAPVDETGVIEAQTPALAEEQLLELRSSFLG
jgi:hypothetical protein